MDEKLAFIGDIHADPVRLTALLAKLSRRSHRLIFLGDYVDHGPDSREVLEILRDTADRRPCSVFLCGNHEIALLAFLSGRLTFLEYAWMGGLATIRSYLGKANRDVRSEFAAAIPPSHVEFLSACKPFFETDQVLAAHAGVNPAAPESRQLAQIVLGRHPSLFGNGFRFDKLLICGHYLQKTLTPFISSSIICLNTGCGTIGGLRRSFSTRK
ncbi:MAG: metallophosphoesterase [Candidatus Acidiferrales bacterium]